MTADTGSVREGSFTLGTADLPEIVEVHMAAFPDAAMTMLGKRVVDRYYRWQLEGPHPEPFGAGFRRDGALIGFLFGGVRRDAVSGFARRYLGTVLLACATHPRGAVRLFGPGLLNLVPMVARRLLGRGRGAEVPQDGGTSNNKEFVRSASFGILSLAVVPEHWGTGVADVLLNVAGDRARSLGMRFMHLTVDPDNLRAERFYERNGFRRVENSVAAPTVERPGGTSWDGRMRKDLAH